MLYLIVNHHDFEFSVFELYLQCFKYNFEKKNTNMYNVHNLYLLNKTRTIFYLLSKTASKLNSEYTTHIQW